MPAFFPEIGSYRVLLFKNRLFQDVFCWFLQDYEYNKYRICRILLKSSILSYQTANYRTGTTYIVRMATLE